MIQEDDKERLDSVPNGGNYESIKKDNEIQYASLSKNLEYMRISKRMQEEQIGTIKEESHLLE